MADRCLEVNDSKHDPGKSIDQKQKAGENAYLAPRSLADPVH